jgi:hypothetical protein
MRAQSDLIYDVRRKMLRLICHDGCDAHPNVIRRVYELVKVSGTTANPRDSLQSCGVIFDVSCFRIDRATLFPLLLLPESTLPRLLDEATFIVIPKDARHNHRTILDESVEKHWECRTYSRSVDCQRLMEFVSLVLGSSLGGSRHRRHREEAAPPPCDFLAGHFTPFPWPLAIRHTTDPIPVQDHPPPSPTGRQFYSAEGERQVLRTVPSPPFPPLPFVGVPAKDPIWKR